MGDRRSALPNIGRWMAVALALHLCAATFSTGFHGLDEHFQTIEFANALLGNSPRATLPLEYHAQARPALQPVIYAAVARIWEAIGVTSPFVKAWSFHVLSAGAGWLALLLLARACGLWLVDDRVRRWAGPVLALAWFLPYIDARTSSEALAGACCTAALALVAIGRRNLATGLLLGLAFSFRYQTGFVVAGIGLYVIFVARAPWRETARLGWGLVAGIALGLCADRFFYGVWVFTPWNYFRFQVIEGTAASFGVTPWWTYVPLVLSRAGPPLSLLLAGGVLIGWLRRPLHLLTWATFPFVLVHLVMGHKEVRFLFPIAAASVALVLLVADDVVARLRASRWLKIGLGIVIAENALLLAVAVLKPANAIVGLYSRIYEAVPSGIALNYLPSANPYVMDGLPLNFYRKPGLNLQPVERLDRLPSGETWLVAPGFLPSSHAGALPSRCVADYRTLPGWVARFDFNGWVKRAKVWTLFRCRPRSTVPQRGFP